ncbi:hypothetical protein C8R44DRAFT_322675 [Mycena epipterygia]|nr:hypothetical protein C8R44DRAFT_322675 [Mycena epipterygia]
MSALALQNGVWLLRRRTSSRVLIRNYTDIQWDSPVREQRIRTHNLNIISTLNPNLLKTGDFLNLSRRTSITIQFPDTVGAGQPLQYTRSDKNSRIPFPLRSRGFLYYHSEPSAGPLEGSLRFRLTMDNSPSSFVRGEDLHAPWGLPWEIVLPQIACRAEYTKIREQLLHEGLATEDQLSLCRDIFHKQPIHSRYTLFRLNSTFLAHFSRMRLTIVGDALHALVLDAPFKDTGSNTFPWTGSALFRFEPSSRAEHAGRRVVHLRIVKIIEPVEPLVEGYNGRVLKPEEGELLAISSERRAAEPWSYDIDRKAKSAAALRVLWEKSGLP